MTGKPNWMERGRTPIALHTEKRPPTKSQNPNTFSSAMPNLDVSGMLVEQAHMWLLTISASLSSPRPAYSLSSHLRQLLAFKIVSAVVNVFELTKNSVSYTSRS